MKRKPRSGVAAGRDRTRAADPDSSWESASAAGRTPFADLTPDTLLDALTAVGLRPDGRLLALNSFENRVYMVWPEEGEPVVAKFYRPGRWSDAAILEEHAFVDELVAAELPAVAPLLLEGRSLHFAGEAKGAEALRFAVYPRQGGRQPEFERPQTLAWMGRMLARMHQVGARAPFLARRVLDVRSFGEAPRDFLWRSGFLPAELADVYFGVVDAALAGVRDSFARAGAVTGLRLHGDCHAGNVLWTDAGPHFVDFDDACMGPAVQDLWMLLAGERAEQQQQLGEILDAYTAFRSFDPRELYLIEALRTLRLIHYAGWLARRADDPAFQRAFPWFNTTRYWQDRILELREQIPLMEEAPLVV
ncbi:serine/threonine protein kinase [Rhodocyclus gracilis]|uniref:Stress response kinase A n=1 Tax=Rhodocyclus tenuis TaxID=1066 RepID=A0A6L5JXM7_RHOTE|nr:serine/threonine protein kinase [Rhodocyclus gracilis]MQY52083.1 serine/threonine protein kinase [Rhodocyclus gracilis]